MWRVFTLAVCCLALGATLRAADSITAGSISSTAAIAIDGTVMPQAAAPSWPLVDQDEIATTSAPAQIRTAGPNAVTLQAETRARIRTAQPGQLYVYLRAGGLTFDSKANGISICAHDRLFLPAMPAKGSVKVSTSGVVAASGKFSEASERPCSEDGFAGLVTEIPGTGAAGGTAVGPGAAGTGAAGGGTAAAAAGVVAVGAAAAAGLATTTGESTCTSAAGCNFNPAPVSSSSP